MPSHSKGAIFCWVFFHKDKNPIHNPHHLILTSRNASGLEYHLDNYDSTWGFWKKQILRLWQLPIWVPSCLAGPESMRMYMEGFKA